MGEATKMKISVPKLEAVGYRENAVAGYSIGFCQISNIGITSITRQKECLLKNYIKTVKGSKEVFLIHWLLKVARDESPK